MTERDRVIQTLQAHLAELLNRPVDPGALRSLKPCIRRQVEGDLVAVFSG